MIIDDQIAVFLAHLGSERGLAATTLAAYRRDLIQYRDFLDGTDPDVEAVSAFVALLEQRGLAQSSIARKIAAVRGFHRFAAVEGMRADDPTVLVETPRRSRSLPKALEIDEVLRLLEVPSPTTPAGRRDRAILEFLYGTGARVAELVALDLEDLDLEAGTAILTGKGDKQRLVPVGSHAVTAVRAYLPDRHRTERRPTDPGAVFLNARGRRLTRQGVWGIVRARALEAGIPSDRVSPHVLRHSAATHMVEGGADLRTVQELLGHASITTTQVYTRVSPRHLLEVYATAHPRS